MKIKHNLNSHGFTLMEILFVLLIIALIVSFAVPAIRSARLDAKNAQAKTALKKLAEARRSFYQYNNGVDIHGGELVYTPNNLEGLRTTISTEPCNTPSATGKPSSSYGSSSLLPDYLFRCGFLDWRDFAGLPYEFKTCYLNGVGDNRCEPKDRYAIAYSANDEEVGNKYRLSCGYYMYIGTDMKVQEVECSD